ncbi:MAG: PAS domain-containing protein [Thalassobaculaceae bacterium]|nr:PAS domain-containing protein [Thalassobaculaceae bacterium]
MDRGAKTAEFGKAIADVRSPLLLQAFHYWDDIRGEAAMPGRSDLDPIDIPTLLPHVILLDVIPPNDRLKVRLVGTQVVQMFGADYTGLFLDEINFGEVREKVLRDYNGAVGVARPIFSDHTFRKLGGFLFDIERVILPLSEDGRSVTMLLAVLDFSKRGRRRLSEI